MMETRFREMDAVLDAILSLDGHAKSINMHTLHAFLLVEMD